jgi:hypothetical protein
LKKKYPILIYKENNTNLINKLLKFHGQSREPGNIGHDEKQKQKHNTICVGHHYAQPKTHNVKALSVQI